MKLNLILLFALCPIMATAQRNCDLQMSVTHPSPNQVFSPSTPTYLGGVIKNTGPDTVMETDELRVQWILDGLVITFMKNGVTDSFLRFTNVHLLPNDTFSFKMGPGTIAGLPDGTYSSCLEVSITPSANPITDPVPSNNISCINFTMSSVNSTDEVSKYSQVKIFPNPASGIIYWETDNRFKPVHIEVLNSIGKRIYSVKENNTRSLDLSGLPSGLYFLKMVAADKEMVVKQFLLQP